jgi:hypothetical protein
MTDPQNVVENTLVPHVAFQTASRRLERCFDHAKSASEPICIALVGESRTGKSRLLEECVARHPTVRNSDGLIIPILMVKTPSKPTVKGLAELMLHALHEPLFDKGTENAKTLRLRRLLRECRTTMVVIDEFQHFYDKGSHKVMHHVADWLKILVDDAKVALVVAGLPTCQAVIEQNEQLRGRFLAPVYMPRFNWMNGKDREEFIDILGAFNQSLGHHFDLPDLDTPEMAFRIYAATGGLMGYLTKFLRQLVWNVLDDQQTTIELSDMVRAHDEAVWAKEGLLDIPSPFTREFPTQPTDDLIARIQKLGTHVEPPLPPRIVRHRSKAAPSVSSVLSAS